MRWLLVLLLLSGAVAVGLRYLPPAWDPRAPLDLTAPPNLLTPLKLAWLRQSPAACRAAFARSGIAFTPLPDRASDAGCALENTLRLPQTPRGIPADPTVTCPLAAAWVLFERNSLQPAASAHLGSGVAAIRHFGTYACRNVNHATAGRRSQHATANAIDVAAFVLRDGREVSVLRDWGGQGDRAAFLRAVRDGACRWFGAVLGPDHNAAHRNHFHLDMGRWQACR
ncbi:hypothetical protein C8P66_10199 [Humitalea rosea]|uniref:Extensin-like C-terminal domain-containing protein n=1 Tax=Humitalea rosea TaxID=990373 RepID=A0A2W7ITP5_9PROT|nr:extensin family protein [Humitalea rosea]PZW50884.1 hypothetical protein C8P66_10199 [Humitalea rosea]